jgi:hypothetical protein
MSATMSVGVGDETAPAIDGRNSQKVSMLVNKFWKKILEKDFDLTDEIAPRTLKNSQAILQFWLSP